MLLCELGDTALEVSRARAFAGASSVVRRPFLSTSTVYTCCTNYDYEHADPLVRGPVSAFATSS